MRKNRLLALFVNRRRQSLRVDLGALEEAQVVHRLVFETNTPECFENGLVGAGEVVFIGCFEFREKEREQTRLRKKRQLRYGEFNEKRYTHSRYFATFDALEAGRRAHRASVDLVKVAIKSPVRSVEKQISARRGVEGSCART
jgi:hypothetical protein